MTEYIDKKDQKWKELKLKWSAFSPKQWSLMVSQDHSISSEHFNQN